jgi:hypothetical protein
MELARLTMVVVMVGCPEMAMSQTFIPFYQYHSHMQAAGQTAPTMHSPTCAGEALKFEAVIGRDGEVIHLKQQKDKRRLLKWPTQAIESAASLLRRSYRPFLVNGRPQAVRTILEVRCKALD